MNEKLITKLKEVIIEAGEISLSLRKKGLKIEKKKDNSPVSNADIAISNFIYAKLSTLAPETPIICEEREVPKLISQDEMFWLVDPIDGTKSYIKNKNSFTINIALIYNQFPILGFIYQPIFRKLHFTNHEKKLSVEQDGKSLEVKRSNPYYTAVTSSDHFNLETEKYIKDNNFAKIIKISSSIKLCMIADNSADLYPKFGPTMEWDIAAGHALIKASGGRIIDRTTGKELLYGKNNLLNSNFIAHGRDFPRNLLTT